MSSDSHISCDVGDFSLALALLDELAFPEELVVNSSPKRLLDFFALHKNTAQGAPACKERPGSKSVYGAGRQKSA